MPYTAPPAKTSISDTYPNPSNAVARAGFGQLWEYVTNLLGATGSPPAAQAALGLVIGTNVQAYNTELQGASQGGINGFKNRIINGNMRIDQRNAGASITPTAGQYSVDRWACALTQASKYTVQQNAGSVTPPTGYSKYLGITSSSAYSIVTGDAFNIYQAIEGQNLIDLAWGTASAATVTLSFWVRSSLTGTFGGSLQNYNASRSYPFSYTISAANTWEQKSITVIGDTSGTWLTTNGVGMYFSFGLGVGATYSGTAGTWAGSNYISATGATSVVGTSGATFYITGVQLEKGSTATSFDYRPYGTELALCRRYFRKLTGISATPLSCQGPQYLDANTIYFSYQADLNDMRAAPTAALIGTANTDYAVWNSPFSQQTGFTINAVAYTNFGGVQFQTTKSVHGLSNNPQIYFGTVTTTGALTLSSEL